MSEQAPQPLNPEQNDYDEFFELVTQHSRERAKRAGQVSMPESSFGSPNGDYVATFQQDVWGYRLNITGNSTRIPLDLIGITFEQMLDSGVEKDVAHKIQAKGVHQLEIIIMKTRLMVQGTFMNRGKKTDRWDGEISGIRPNTMSILPLITRTAHDHKE